MSDEETYSDHEEPQQVDAPPSTPKVKQAPVEEGGKSEAEMMMEEKRRKDKEKYELDMAEFEEMRREEREKLEEEIADLKAKREVRKQEREEEERKQAERRAIEDQKRRAEEEERQRKKMEEQQKRREAMEKAQQEAEERAKMMGKRSFTITRKGKAEESSEDTPQEAAKSKEQLEAEKQAILKQRIQPMGDTSSMSESDLQAKAKEIHDILLRLVSDNYDLEQHFKQRLDEMNELAERVRQMNKGKGKKMAVSQENDALAEKFTGIPPKIVLCSKYERHKDRRTYVERKDVFTGPIYAEETPRILPQSERGDEGGEPAEAGGEEEE